MKKRLCAVLAVMLWLAVASVSPAQDAAAAGQKPLVTVSFAGYDQLMSTIGKAGQLAGRPELAKGLEGMLVLFTQGKGLAGLDKARPWGVVVYGSDDGKFPIQAFVPVTDLKQLMALSPKPMTPDAAGVYELPADPQKTFYAAQKGQWAFIVDNKDALGSVPADPAAALGDLSKKYLLAVRGSVKNLPPAVRDQFLATAKMTMGMFQRPQPGESDDQRAMRTNMLNQAFDKFTTLAKELDGALLGLGMDSSTGAVYLDCEIVAQPGTKTAQQFAGAQDAKTNFAGFQVPGAAVTCLSVGTLDDAEVAQLKGTFTKVRAMAMKDIDGNGDLTDPQKQLAKQLLGDAMDVFDKTIDSRKSDGGVALLLEAGAPTLVAGVSVAEGAKLDKLLRQIVAEAAKENPPLANLVKLDADKHEGVTFHVASVPVPDPEAAALFGKQLDLVVGIGGESLYFGAGKNALATLKQVIDASKGAAGKTVPPMQLVVTGGPIAKFIAQVAPAEEAKAIAGQVAQLLAACGGKDHVTLAVRPIPNGTSMRLSVEEGLLKSILSFIPIGGGPGGPPGAKNKPPTPPAGGNDVF